MLLKCSTSQCIFYSAFRFIMVSSSLLIILKMNGVEELVIKYIQLYVTTPSNN